MKFHYYLRPQSGATTQTITLVCYFNTNKKKVKFAASTGFRVAPNHWSVKDERVKNVLAATNSQTINNFLNALKAFLEKRHIEIVTTGEGFTPETLKGAIDDFLHPKKQMTFVEFIEQHIEAAKTKNNVATHKKITQSTIYAYKKTLTFLKEFGKKNPIGFKDMDIKFYERFVLFFEAKNMMPNTIGKYIKTLKSFIRAADESGIEVSQDYKRKAFRVQRQDVENVYLNEAELQKLFELDLSNNKTTATARDGFLVGCHTGLRFEDCERLRPVNIVTEIDEAGKPFNVIKTQTQKTGTLVIIPISETLQKIIDAHGGGFPKMVNNAEYNLQVKKLGQLIGLTKLVEISETRGGILTQQTYQKWELITFHTSRRSFATNQFLKEIPTITIMKMTGHKTEASFMKYIKVTETEHAKIMLKNWNTKPESVLKAVV